MFIHRLLFHNKSSTSSSSLVPWTCVVVGSMRSCFRISGLKAKDRFIHAVVSLGEMDLARPISLQVKSQRLVTSEQLEGSIWLKPSDRWFRRGNPVHWWQFRETLRSVMRFKNWIGCLHSYEVVSVIIVWDNRSLYTRFICTLVWFGLFVSRHINCLCAI